ncbi:carbohydrate binding domain-containing protein [Chondrinema litorale]|uniref:carbohydrate binding domain-containing protein n=1 Tax=Chondrinema litorale TaxID=2994555 RepID=UPI002542DE43|nr:carbohydrate binding domain-containing protein [Chondrinema litorale]UZR96668.1 carbohydrate binding domain-containing protein [Chondrinema litorale]
MEQVGYQKSGKKLWFAFIPITILFLSSFTVLKAETIKVFSRYNYYLPNNEISIIAILPDDASAAEFQLNLSQGTKTIEVASDIEGQRLSATFKASILSIGTTSIHFSITQIDNIVQEGDVDIVLQEAKANAVQIDKLTGGLIADGLPFFPFGFYCVPVGNLPEKEVVHGMNLIAPYQSNLPDGLEERKAYMDRCAELGIKVQYSVNSLIGSGHNGSRGLDMSDEDKLALLKSEVKTFRDHPALLSWYINDEPDGQGRPPEILEAAYNVIHELDTYHPVSIVFMMPSQAEDFKNTMDIAMTDPYPIPGPPEQVLNNINGYGDAYKYEKSVWLVPQAFGGQEMWNREPTAKELRVMTYMGLISGAKGIQYFIRGEGNTNPQSVSAWSECSNMAVETSQMAPFLLSADDAPKVSASDERILTRAFKYKGNLLVMAINEDNTPKEFSIKVDNDGGNYKDEAALWFENRSVDFDGKQINDMIDAHGTRVYLIDQKETKKKSQISSRNLIVNPSFEILASPGQPIGFNKTYTSYEKKDLGATTFADSRQSVEGMVSLRIINPVDSGGNKIRFLPLVVNKDNSYVVTIWAKAKAQGEMPTFRLSMGLMNEIHTYEISTEWQEYSFVFTAPSSSTNNILSLELLRKGTAWFDLLQMSPTPVIQYEISEDKTAEVKIEGAPNDGQIRYAIDKAPDAKSSLYQKPITIKKASTVYAGIFEGSRQVAASKLFVPVNLALGKPVTLAIPFHEKYAANGNNSLTDGIMGSTAFKDGKWLGFSGEDLSATIDLQAKTKVNKVSGSFLCDPNSGIFLPSKILVYTSVDGDKFDLVGEQENLAGNVRGEPQLHQISVSLKEKPVRYIRLVAKAFGKIPEGYLFTGSTSWLFADEILIE